MVVKIRFLASLKPLKQALCLPQNLPPYFTRTYPVHTPYIPRSYPMSNLGQYRKPKFQKKATWFREANLLFRLLANLPVMDLVNRLIV